MCLFVPSYFSLPQSGFYSVHLYFKFVSSESKKFPGDTLQRDPYARVAGGRQIFTEVNMGTILTDEKWRYCIRRLGEETRI